MRHPAMPRALSPEGRRALEEAHERRRAAGRLTRLRILECVSRGTVNPKRIATELGVSWFVVLTHGRQLCIEWCVPLNSRGRLAMLRGAWEYASWGL